MNVIGTTEALESLNKRLQRPVSRQLFSQSIAPVLMASGYAKQIGGVTIIDGEAWAGWWIGYIAFRESKISAGEWGASRPYSAAEAEDFRDGVYDEEAQRMNHAARQAELCKRRIISPTGYSDARTVAWPEEPNE